MGFYGNLVKEEEVDVIELEIYTECDLLLLEISCTTTISLDIGKGKQCNVLIRNKESASRNQNGEINHGPSIKIKNTKIIDDPATLLIPKENEKSKFDQKIDKKTAAKLERKYSDVMDFVDDNSKILTDLWNCKDKNEFNELISKLEK